MLTVALLQSRVAEAVAYALPFSAGVTLYVAASDLIPEVNHMEQKNPLVSIVVFGGVALFYLLHLSDRRLKAATATVIGGVQILNNAFETFRYTLRRQ